MELFQIKNLSILSIAYYILSMITSISIIIMSIKLYTKTSNYNDIEILKKGNAALAWISGGMLLGLIMSISIININGGSFLDILIKDLLATTVQIIFYLIFPKLSTKYQEEVRENNNIAVGMLIGCIYLSFGIINGASF